MARRDASLSQPCPCGSGRSFQACCHPYLSGVEAAPTAEALMRSRYSAYATSDVDYLLDTWHPDSRPAELDLAGSNIKWVGLEVIDTKEGGEQDETGEVEFVARCKVNGKAKKLHERSRFVRESGKWVYVDAVTGNL